MRRSLKTRILAQGGVSALTLIACRGAVAAPKFAAPVTDSISGSTGVGSISAVVFGLAVVLALIFGFAWVTRRLQGFQAGGASIEVHAQINVGQKERVLLISVAGTRLLVGVGSGTVTTLHTFAADDAALQALLSPSIEAPRNPVTDRFRDILQRSLGAK